MKKKIILSILIAILIIIAALALISLLFAIEKKNSATNNGLSVDANTEEVVFDWEVKVLRTSKAPNLQTKEDAEDFAAKVMALLPAGQQVLKELNGPRDDGTYYGFIMKMTDRGYRIFKTVDLEGSGVRSVYYDLIIDQESQKEPDDNEELYACNQDRECIFVKNDCCGCSSMGTATTINRDYYNYWTEKQATECVGRACAASFSHDPSCFKEPACVGGRCELVTVEGNTR